MPEEYQIDDVELEKIQTDAPGTAATDEPKPESNTVVEDLARKTGWVPKEEYHGTKEWVPADEYILRGNDMLHTINKVMKQQKKDNESMQKAVADLKKHNENVYRAEVARLEAKIEKLSMDKKEAIKDGDLERVEEIEHALAENKEKVQQAAPKEESGEVEENPEYVEWRDKNQWYGKDDEMTALADTIATRNPKMVYSELLEKIENAVRKSYPENFESKGNGNGKGNGSAKPAVSSVESGGTRFSGKAAGSKLSFADLSHEQQQIAINFEKKNIMSRDEYMREL